MKRKLCNSFKISNNGDNVFRSFLCKPLHVHGTKLLSYLNKRVLTRMPFTDEELGFDHNSLLDQQAESASDGDDDTLVYYPGSNETSDPRKTETSPAKRNSKTGSDYCRIYDRVNGYDAELKGKIIHSVQEEDTTEAITGAKEDNSSQRHQRKQQTEGLTNEKDGGTLI